MAIIQTPKCEFCKKEYSINLIFNQLGIRICIECLKRALHNLL